MSTKTIAGALVLFLAAIVIILPFVWLLIRHLFQKRRGKVKRKRKIVDNLSASQVETDYCVDHRARVLEYRTQKRYIHGKGSNPVYTIAIGDVLMGQWQLQFVDLNSVLLSIRGAEQSVEYLLLRTDTATRSIESELVPTPNIVQLPRTEIMVMTVKQMKIAIVIKSLEYDNCRILAMDIEVTAVPVNLEINLHA